MSDTLVRDSMTDRVEHMRAPLGSGGLDEKQVDFEASTFEAFSAAIGNKDDGGDVIMPGAFRKTIQERLPRGRVKLLDAHRADLIGRVLGVAEAAAERELTMEERQEVAEFLGIDVEDAPTHRLWSQFKVSPNDDAQDALRNVAEGIVDAVSIGYQTVKVEFVKDDDAPEDIDAEVAFLRGHGVRRIHELKWWETSLVPWGMNRAAVAMPDTVRSALRDVRDLEEGPVSEKEVRWAIRSLKGLLGDVGHAGQAAREVMTEVCDSLDAAAGNVDECSCSVPDDARGQLERAREAFHESSDQLDARDFHTFVAKALEEREDKAVTEFQDLSLANREREWSSDDAIDRVREATDSEEEPSEKYREAFLWYDADEDDEFGAYKLPYADIIDGTMTAVPRGVFAAAAAVEGARGGVDIPDGDVDGVQSHIESYYEKMRDEFDDEDIVAPWNEDEESSADDPEEAKEEDDVEDISAEDVKEIVAETVEVAVSPIHESLEMMNDRVTALSESETTPEGGDDEAAGAPDEEKSEEESSEDDDPEGRSDERFEEKDDDEAGSTKTRRKGLDLDGEDFF